MKPAPLSFEVFSASHVKVPTFAEYVANKASAKKSRDKANRVSRRRLTRSLSVGGFFLASFAIIVSLNDSRDTALAADDPTVAISRSSQGEPLDVPGSFKDLPEAKDLVTAKRSAESIKPPSATNPAAATLEIDAGKIAGANPEILYAEGDLVNFDATAYCLKGRTASGIDTRPGVIAADPRVLPMGTVVHLRAGRYTGTYTVMDTGSRIRGRRVDVYVPTYKEAVRFGRQQVKIKVIDRGSAQAVKARRNLLASDR